MQPDRKRERNKKAEQLSQINFVTYFFVVLCGHYENKCANRTRFLPVDMY